MKTISLKINEEEKERIEQFAEENDLTISQVVRKALKEFFNNK